MKAHGVDYYRSLRFVIDDRQSLAGDYILVCFSILWSCSITEYVIHLYTCNDGDSKIQC